MLVGTVFSCSTPAWHSSPSSHGVFGDAHLRQLEEVFRSACEDFECQLVESNGEANHVRLLVNFPPKVPVARLVNSFEGVSSRWLCQEFPELARHYWRARRLWLGSFSPGRLEERRSRTCVRGQSCATTSDNRTARRDLGLRPERPSTAE